VSVEIVPIERRHIGAFREVLDAVAREGRYLAFLEAPPLPQVRRVVQARLQRGAVHLVALDGGQLVGWCDVTPKEHPTLRHSGVLGLGVAAAHRRRGIGQRLLTATLEAAVAGGLSRVELIVRADNGPAIALYERLGFATEGLCRRYLQIGGIGFDARLMAWLGPPVGPDGPAPAQRAAGTPNR